MNKRKYFAVLVKTPFHKKQWYTVSKKLQEPLWYSISHNPKWYQYLVNSLVTVPTCAYNKEGQTKLALGWIQHVSIGYYCKHDYHQTRSQFLTQDRLKKGFWSCYQYIRHDYSFMNRVRLFLSLVYWKYHEILLNWLLFLLAVILPLIFYKHFVVMWAIDIVVAGLLACYWFYRYKFKEKSKKISASTALLFCLPIAFAISGLFFSSPLILITWIALQAFFILSVLSGFAVLAQETN